MNAPLGQREHGRSAQVKRRPRRRIARGKALLVSLFDGIAFPLLAAWHLRSRRVLVSASWFFVLLGVFGFVGMLMMVHFALPFFSPEFLASSRRGAYAAI